MIDKLISGVLLSSDTVNDIDNNFHLRFVARKERYNPWLCGHISAFTEMKGIANRIATCTIANILPVLLKLNSSGVKIEG